MNKKIILGLFSFSILGMANLKPNQPREFYVNGKSPATEFCEKQGGKSILVNPYERVCQTKDGSITDEFEYFKQYSGEKGE